MTSLHPTSADPALPGPPAGSSPPADAPADAPPGAAGAGIPGAPVCSIATAAEGGPTGTTCAAGAPARHDSVPQPRTPEDVEAQLRLAAAGGSAVGGDARDSTAAGGDATADRLRAAFADRLRAARAGGRSLAELAAACRRSVAEVRALLGEAGDGDGDGDEETGGRGGEAATGAPFGETGPGFVRFQQTAAPSEGNRPAPAPRSAREASRESMRDSMREEVRSLGSRRPSPSRRLRRMHPRADRTGQEATARETAATHPTGAEPRGAGRAGELTGVPRVVADRTPPAAGSDAWSVAGGGSEESRAVPPLGILIGGSPVQPEAVGRPEERTPVRAAAEPIRVGRGTSLVVLPSWRPAIAVSVSTEQLVVETGLTVEQLTGAQLTVLMNPWALHDRELDLHGWEPGPPGRPRRGGRG
ncbi:hypothetical protein [Kitasatospora sp. NPDC001683]